MAEKKDPINVVAVFAHPDDEAGIIGTLANHAQKGDNVHAIFLTRGENASSLCCTPEEIMEIRGGHVKQIEAILGVKYHLLDLPDSGVHPSVENAKRLAGHFKELQPHIVITWCQSEQIGVGHPDHRYTYDITLDALSYCRFKNPDDKHDPHRDKLALFTTYFVNSHRPEGLFFVDVSQQLDKIMAVVDVYIKAYGEWPVKEYIKAQLMINGRMVGVDYAEAFNKILWRTAQPYLF